jgi:hypothetical protein
MNFFMFDRSYLTILLLSLRNKISRIRRIISKGLP